METRDKKNIGNQGTLLPIDLTDPAYKPLFRSARRIGKLLGERTVCEDPNLEACLDDFLGAVYALILAKYYGFDDRLDRSPEIEAYRKRAGQIAEGEVRIDGKWMAGFHFNSALFRAAAVYHRILKIVVGRPAARQEYVPQLLPDVKNLYRRWKSAAWSNRRIHAVHEQVNDLKHTTPGVYHGRTVKYEHAVAGVDELLELIETWADSRIPQR